MSGQSRGGEQSEMNCLTTAYESMSQFKGHKQTNKTAATGEIISCNYCGTNYHHNNKAVDETCSQCGNTLFKERHNIGKIEAEQGSIDLANPHGNTQPSTATYNDHFGVMELHHPDGQVETPSIGGKFMDMDNFFAPRK